MTIPDLRTEDRKATLFFFPFCGWAKAIDLRIYKIVGSTRGKIHWCKHIFYLSYFNYLLFFRCLNLIVYFLYLYN